MKSLDDVQHVVARSGHSVRINREGSYLYKMQHADACRH